jgi:hypothetical protein
LLGSSTTVDAMGPTLGAFLSAQQGVVSSSQARTVMTESALRVRLRRDWQIVLPGVYAAFRGPLTSSQQVRAALLYAGPSARITDAGALTEMDVRFVPEDSVVRVLVDWTVRRRSISFVSVTRTRYLPEPVVISGVPYAPLARALVDLGTRLDTRRDVCAVFADAVQRRLTSMEALSLEVLRGPRAGRSTNHEVMVDLTDGVRSAPEADFRRLAIACRGVPKPMFNALLQLPNGRYISPDALLPDAGLVHETNGRLAHEEDDLFSSMQERHDVMTTAGLTVLHNPPRRLLTAGPVVQREWSQCAGRLAGQGLPVGVTIVRLGPDGWDVGVPRTRAG